MSRLMQNTELKKIAFCNRLNCASSFLVMISGVFAHCIKKIKILNPIVSFIFVNMMASFFLTKEAIKMLFNYKNMFSNIATFCGVWVVGLINFNITSYLRTTTSLIIGVLPSKMRFFYPIRFSMFSFLVKIMTFMGAEFSFRRRTCFKFFSTMTAFVGCFLIELASFSLKMGEMLSFLRRFFLRAIIIGTTLATKSIIRLTNMTFKFFTTGYAFFKNRFITGSKIALARAIFIFSLFKSGWLCFIRSIANRALSFDSILFHNNELDIIQNNCTI